MDEENKFSHPQINIVPPETPFDQFSMQTLVYNNNSSEWFYANKGFTVNTRKIPFDFFYTDDSGRNQTIKVGTCVGDWDFTPFGPTYVSGSRTAAVSQFIAGVEGLLGLSRTVPGIKMPEFLVNITNPRMANFMKKFGFQTVKPEKGAGYPQKKIRLGQVQVVGKVEDIRKTLIDIKEQKGEFLDKLSLRKGR